MSLSDISFFPLLEVASLLPVAVACYWAYEMGRLGVALISGYPVLKIEFGCGKNPLYSGTFRGTEIVAHALPVFMRVSIFRGKAADGMYSIDRPFIDSLFEWLNGESGARRERIHKWYQEKGHRDIPLESLPKSKLVAGLNIVSGWAGVVCLMWLVLFGGYYFYVPFVGPSKELKIANVFGSAREGGLIPESRIVSVNGRQVSLWREVYEALDDSPNEIALGVLNSSGEARNVRYAMSRKDYSYPGFRPVREEQNFSALEAAALATSTPFMVAGVLVEEAYAYSYFADTWCPSVRQTFWAQWRFGSWGYALYFIVLMGMVLSLPVPGTEMYRLLLGVRGRSHSDGNLGEAVKETAG